MIRAYVGDHGFGFSVGVSLVLHHGDEHTGPASIMRLGELGETLTWEWEEIAPGAQVKPTFVLDHGMARALADGLNTHFSGVEDNRALRRDYDAERKRVDKLTDALAGIAHTLVQPET
ncbi:hypothetical protein [Pseudonocardia sp.]|uniref:hypothetical protein n=1 Tax=Pseudonocardia sp. TaxID=60912 RepID=UPI002622BB88|nr:hypothetical protein [Pseudonocardia sp.]MCW2720700.1 hypothetical protein [Pseudonocardia sp.]